MCFHCLQFLRRGELLVVVVPGAAPLGQAQGWMGPGGEMVVLLELLLGGPVVVGVVVVVHCLQGLQRGELLVVVPGTAPLSLPQKHSSQC